MTDLEFQAAVEDCTFPGSEWTHLAHVRLGWMYCRSAESLDAAMAICRQTIRRYNLTVLQKEAYHETITFAFVRLLRSRLRDAPPGENFDEFCARNPDLLSSQAVLKFFSQRLLDSDQARAEVVPPDIAPLPEC